MPIDFAAPLVYFRAFDPRGGEDKPIVLPVVRMEVRYAINQIPAASILLPVGWGKNRKLSPALELLWKVPLTTRLRGQLFVTSRIPTPEGPAPWRLLFDGYVVSIQSRMVRGTAGLSLTMVSWLSDLAVSSSTSAALLPDAAGVLAAAMIYGTAGPRPAAAQQENLALFHTGLIDGLPEPGDDLWESLLAPICRRLATDYYHSLMPVLPPGCTFDQETMNNPPARAALDRIESRLQFHPSIAPVLRFELAQYLGMMLVSSFVELSLWDKLVGQLLPEFLASIVPLPDRALLVPYAPGLWFHGAAFQKFKENNRLHDEEIVSLDGTSTVYRPIHGVLLVPMELHMPTQAGVQMPRQVRACFMNPQARGMAGLLSMVTLPAWMNQMRFNANWLTPTPDPASGLNPQDVGTNQQPLEPPMRAPQPDPIPTDDQRLLEAYARLMYLDQVLRSRSLVVTTALRTDIAPGTPVCVDFPIRHAPQHLSGPTAFYGTAAEVHIVIDAENRLAQTQFRVDHVRSSAEFGEDKEPEEMLPLNLHTHPFYVEPFMGAPLIEDFQWYRRT